MLNVNLIGIGKLKEDYLRSACGEYQKRLAAFCKLNIVELPEYRLPSEPSPAQINQGLEVEGKMILQKCGGMVIALCIEGKEFSSPALAERINAAAVGGKSELDFVIGGSFGLSEEVKARADLKLSMSPMTFPHQLARVMLLEQLYRCFQINSGGKYHK